MTQHAPLADEDQAPARDGLWSGVIGFASIMLLLLGGFHGLGGIVALLTETHYEVPSSQLVVSVSYDVYGWIHLALGVALCFLGVALIARQPWTRVAVVVLAVLSALTNLAFLAAAPAWYSLMILLDVVVIYAVTVHFDAGTDFDY
jgi:hypothetical protein